MTSDSSIAVIHSQFPGFERKVYLNSCSPPIPSVYGATEGTRLLLDTGTASVAAHVKLLTANLLKGTAELGIAAKTPGDNVGPLVVLKAHNSDALAKILAENGFVASNRLDGLRISFHLYNTLEDVRPVLELLDKNVERLVTSKQLRTAGTKQ